MGVLLVIVLLVFLLLFLAAIVFYGIIFPVWMIVHCANSEALSKKGKSLWIIAMILLWPISGSLYGLFVTGQRRLQWFSGIFLFMCLAMAIAVLLHPEILKNVQRNH